MATITTFHNPFHTPFNLFAPGDDRVPWVYPVSIAGHPFIMDFKKSQILTLQVRRQSADDSVEPGEQTLSAAGVWPRAQDNWFLGAGQLDLDNRFAFESVYVHSGEYPSVRTRFNRSLGVNPWTEGKLSLLNEYVQGKAIAGATSMAVVCGQYFYLVDGIHLYYTTLVPGTGSAWTTVTTTNTHNITALVSDGSRVWFAAGADGVFVTSGGTTSVAAAATPPALNGIGGALAYDAGAGTVNATNLPNGAMNYYISEVDAFGNETAAVTVAHTVASLPVNLNWNPDTNASSFKVRRNIGGSDLLIYNGTDPSFVDDGTVAGTVSAHPTTNGTGSAKYAATWLLYAKGHLLASTGRDLVEVLANGSVSFIFQHENPSFTFTCGCETPTAIIVGGYAGNFNAGLGFNGMWSGESFIGAIQPDAATNGATLAPPTWATSLTNGECIFDITYDAGAMVMGTSIGLRTGTKPDSIGTFDVNPAVDFSNGGGVVSVATWGQYCYFGVPNPANLSGMTALFDTWQSGALSVPCPIYRADLSQYTTPGVPAWATDVGQLEQQNGATRQVVIMAGTPLIVTGGELTVPSGKLCQFGWLEPGWIRYGTLENKILVEVDFQCDPLPSGAAIQYQVVLDDQATVVNVGTLEGQGATRAADVLETGLSAGRMFMPIITLYSNAAKTAGPTLRNHISKAMVTTKRQDEILLNLVWKEQVEGVGPAQQTVSQDCFTEYFFLKQLEATGAPVTLQMGAYSRQVYIDQILDKPDDMTGDRQWFQGELTVKLISLT